MGELPPFKVIHSLIIFSINLRPKPPKPFLPSFDQLQVSKRAKDEKVEQRIRPKPKPLPSYLPPEDDAKVNVLFNKRGVVSKHGKEQVSDTDLSRLRPNQWLNDEIINFYGSMIQARSDGSKENPAKNGVGSAKSAPLNVHFFSTFFWSKLKGQGYETGRMAKWTKKVGNRLNLPIVISLLILHRLIYFLKMLCLSQSTTTTHIGPVLP